MSLAGKTILMSGGSRGIGLAIALRAAADGANIALIAKTDTPHPKLEGTIHTAAEAIRAAGGKALPIHGDVRNDEDIARAVEAAVQEFGGIDIVDLPSPGRVEMDGDIVAASYMNFYIGNSVVVVPTYGVANDQAAVDMLAELFPDRRAVGVPARGIIVGGGSFHCSSQQVPA